MVLPVSPRLCRCRRTKNAPAMMMLSSMMMLLISTCTTIVWTILLLGVHVGVVVVRGAELEHDLGDEPCRLWLAPSGVSSESKVKFGLYAGVDYDENETIPHPELGIPLVDFLESPHRDRSPENKEILDFLSGHVWTASHAGGATFEGNHTSSLFIPGAGVLANYHTGVYNVDWLHGSVLLRDDPEYDVPGEAHPGRGAVTPYYNLTIKATEKIRAGMELFANFGDVWDEDDVSVFQDTITRQDYMDADKILNYVVKFMDEYEEDMTDELMDSVLEFMMDKVLGTAVGSRANMIRSLIPPCPGKLRKVKEMGGTFHFRNRDLVKSNKWFLKHAFCVDKMRVGTSTIPHAGRGVFATREIPFRGIITPVPMVPILRKEVTKMHPILEVIKQQKEGSAELEEGEGDGEEQEQEEPEGGEIEYVFDETEDLNDQLIVNYCIGHPESSMLLLPVSSLVNMINHAPSKVKGEKGKDNDDEDEDDGPKANVYLYWSADHDVINDKDLFKLNTTELMEKKNPVLTMNLIASRKIEVGEELLLDYGPDWSEAWEKHVTAFEKAHGGRNKKNKWPLKAADVRRQYKNKAYPLGSEFALPAGVATSCYIIADSVPDGQPKTAEDGETTIMNWDGPATYDEYHGDLLLLCHVLESKPDPDNLFNYTVATVMEGSGEGEDPFPARVLNVPHRAITVVDMPYQSDIHAKGAFRHYIGIANDKMFPQKWRDLRE